MAQDDPEGTKNDAGEAPKPSTAKAAKAPAPDPIPADARADARLEDTMASPKAADPEEERAGGRFARFRKLLEPRELGEDAKNLLGSVIDTSDRAKTEVVKMVAREVRHYLEELKLKEDLRELITSHSLEINASFSLKPLPGKAKAPSDPEPE